MKSISNNSDVMKRIQEEAVTRYSILTVERFSDAVGSADIYPGRIGSDVVPEDKEVLPQWYHSNRLAWSRLLACQ
jgi:hypothetical protein